MGTLKQLAGEPKTAQGNVAKFLWTQLLAGGEFRLLQKKIHRDSVTEIQDCCSFKNPLSSHGGRALHSDMRFIFISSSFSISSPDSTASSASSDNMIDSGNSSWNFSPPPMPHGNGVPLFHMRPVGASLPSRKRGLSNYFADKSQSFTSLANVKCVEELAKPEKKLKSSHSWESTMKSSYNNQTILSSMVSKDSAESMEMACKPSSSGRNVNNESNGLIPCGLLLSSPKEMI